MVTSSLHGDFISSRLKFHCDYFTPIFDSFSNSHEFLNDF